METNLEVLNKISQKLGGSADATSVTESLNNIANALGDTEPDVIKSVSDSLNDILEYAGNGGGGVKPILTFNLVLDGVSNVFTAGYLEYKNGGLCIGYHEITENQELDMVALDFGGAFAVPLFQMLDPQAPVFGTTISEMKDLVNCIYNQEGNVFILTDPTQNASATLVFSLD